MSEPNIEKILVATGLWNSLELIIKVRRKEIQFTGWEAGLMREFLVNQAAMTVEGAHEFVKVRGIFKIGKKPVKDFLLSQVDAGLLKSHKERMIKYKRRKRLILSSALKPGQFKYTIIVHEEEE